ncbi:MAG TPA: sigma-70 family RNA polymerase sigma factor [Polyangiaceae bacterium]|nr:sigma-70 family RNA polymerase sigma factor [Polyangiaceae bacterium]
MPEQDPSPGRADVFPATRWTLILRAAESPEARRVALESLVAPRWRALYAMARKKGFSKERAEDAVQSFVERLASGDALARLDPSRGKLRAYLSAAFSKHLLNVHVHEAALKRGAGRRSVDLDAIEASVPAWGDTPEEVFDRAYAIALYQSALEDLRAEFAAGDRTGPFEILERLFRFGETESYAELAPRYGLTVPQLKSLVHRAKRRFQQLFRTRIAETVDDAADVDAELGAVLSLLAGK